MSERISQEVLDLYDNIDALKKELERKNVIISEFANLVLSDDIDQWPKLCKVAARVLHEDAVTSNKKYKDAL